jgi:hypothetical protein
VENTEMFLSSIKDCYGFEEGEIERFKEEIESENFSKLSKLGSKQRNFTWRRPFPEIFGNSIKIDATIIKMTCVREDNCYCGEDVDYVRKGLKQPKNGKIVVINLPIDMKFCWLKQVLDTLKVMRTPEIWEI